MITIFSVSRSGFLDVDDEHLSDTFLTTELHQSFLFERARYSSLCAPQRAKRSIMNNHEQGFKIDLVCCFVTPRGMLAKQVESTANRNLNTCPKKMFFPMGNLFYTLSGIRFRSYRFGLLFHQLVLT